MLDGDNSFFYKSNHSYTFENTRVVYTYIYINKNTDRHDHDQ